MPLCHGAKPDLRQAPRSTANTPALRMGTIAILSSTSTKNRFHTGRRCFCRTILINDCVYAMNQMNPLNRQWFFCTLSYTSRRWPAWSGIPAQCGIAASAIPSPVGYGSRVDRYSLSDQIFLCDAFRCAEMKHVMDSAAPTIQPTGQADHMPR